MPCNSDGGSWDMMAVASANGCSFQLVPKGGLSSAPVVPTSVVRVSLSFWCIALE